MTGKDDLEEATDLGRNDLNPELFAAALAVQRVGRLLTSGGSPYGRPDDEDSFLPEHFERFIPRALAHAQRTACFELYWRRFQQILPQIKIAWERGQALFQEDLKRATIDQEHMEYLSQIDFARDCYAAISAKKAYPSHQTLQAWAINGYMVAWRQHFLSTSSNESVPQE